MPLLVVQQVKKPHPIVPQSQTAKQISDFSLSTEMQRLDRYLLDLKKRYYSSDFYKQYAEYRETFKTEVYNPLKSAYSHTYIELPEETTKRKFGLLERFSFDSRIIALNGLALGSAIWSMKGINTYNGWMLGVKALRNTAFTYIFAGLIVAPEIFNPLLKRWEKNQVE